MLSKIRALLEPLSITPIHPQWLAKKNDYVLYSYLKNIVSNHTILDIGCFNKWTKNYVPETCFYIGLDYYATAFNWYNSIPDIYGDALKLPFKEETIDTVLLLDVLEHLPDSNTALSEINRVLVSGGELIVRIPFLYPLHDEPLDFVRYTTHGLRKLANRNGFTIERCKSTGHPTETAALLTNIALSKTIITWIKNKNPLAIFIIILPIFIVASNLTARLFSLFSKKDSFMPYSYLLVLRKISSNTSE